MVRFGLVVQGTIERYDDAGRLVDQQAIQPVQVAATSAEALTASLAQLGEQLATAWAVPVAAPAQAGESEAMLGQ